MIFPASKKFFVLFIALSAFVSLVLLTSFNNLYADETANVQVSATIPPGQSDFQFAINPVSSTSSFQPGNVMEAEITYGSRLATPTDLTLVVEWSLGTVENTSTQVDILEYVPGSATNAINNIPPVIDTLNRRITWTIQNFPPNTLDRKVRFSMRMRDIYSGGERIHFHGDAYMLANGIRITDQRMSRDFQRNQISLTSTPTPTAAQTTLTPTPTSGSLRFSGVRVQTITDSKAIVSIATSEKTRVRLSFGTSPNSLTRTVNFDNFLFGRSITMVNLAPQIPYYYRVVATNERGQSISSDTFSFQTARLSDIPNIERETFTIISQNSILYNPKSQNQTATESAKSQAPPTIVLPKNIAYSFRFSIDKKKGIKRVKIVVRRKLAKAKDLVLGKSVLAGEEEKEEKAQDSQVLDTAQEIEVVEVEPGVYGAKLASNLESGEYELVAVMSDEEGNVVEEKLTDVKVTRRFGVISKDTKEPLETVRVLLKRLNEATGKFENLPLDSGIQNPSFTDSKGEIGYVLPSGKYQAQLGLLRFKDKTVEFTIGSLDNEGYPLIEMETAPITIDRLIRYYGRSLRDVFYANTVVYVNSLRSSNRFFDTVAAFSILSLSLLTLLSFRAKTYSSLFLIPLHVLYHFESIWRKNGKQYIEGSVIDDKTKAPLGRVTVFLLDSQTHEVLARQDTQKNGAFFFRKISHPEHYKVLAIKNGYKAKDPQANFESQKMVILLSEDGARKPSVVHRLFVFAEHIFGLAFEFLLVLSFIFEFIFLLTFGLFKTIPYLAISLLNVVLWLLYHHKHH